jgi:hypothetical protein
MDLTTERYQLEQQQITREIEGDRDRILSLCPDCYSTTGMQHYDRESVLFLMEQEAEFTFPNEWWVAKRNVCTPTDKTHDIYRRCGTCRPMGAPDGWLPVSEEYVKLWAHVPCQCKECA